MAQEIERKFLVSGLGFKTEAFHAARIKQGYLSSVHERTVRIRIKDNSGYITIKGASDSKGISRYEWEKEISHPEAIELLKICEPGIIDKTRYEVNFGNHIFEIDEFHGENQGLIIAEIELKSEDELFEKPEWLGQEVTGERKYYNSMLKKNPFSKW